MASFNYMNNSAPFWDFLASLEQQGNNHPFFGQNRNGDNENENGEAHEGQHPPPFDPWSWGHQLFGGERGIPHRGPPPPPGPHGPPPPGHHGPPPHHDEHAPHHEHGEQDGEKSDNENDNGEGPSGSGSDSEGGHPCGRGRHGRCGGRRGFGGRGGFGPHHGGPHHGGPHHGGPHHGGPGRHGPREHHGPPHDGPGRCPRGSHRGPPGPPPHDGPGGPHEGPHGHGPRGHRGPRHHGGPGRHGPWGFNGHFGGPCGRRGFGGPHAGPQWGAGAGFDPSDMTARILGPLFEAFTAEHPSNKNDDTAKDSEDFSPEADIFDTPSAYIVHISLPGAKKEDVGANWDAEKSELSIAGVVYRPGDEEFLKTLAMNERKVGPFERKIRLGTRANPAHVDADGITAKLEDGVLRVEVRKEDEEFVEIKKVDIE